MFKNKNDIKSFFKKSILIIICLSGFKGVGGKT